MMSIRYLYVIQRDEEPATITILDYASLQPNIRDMKFMIMHCSVDVIGAISRFLTKGGYIFNQSHSHHVGALVSETFKIVAGGRFPISDMYLVLGPLQSEVIVKLYLRNPIDVDVKALIEKIDTVSKSIEVSDKLFSDIVLENQALRKMVDALIATNTSLRVDVDQLSAESAETYCSIDAMSKDIDDINDAAISKLSADISRLSTENASLHCIVNGLISVVDELRERVSEMREDMDKKAFINGSYFDDVSEPPVAEPEKTEIAIVPTPETVITDPPAVPARWGWF